MKKIAFIPWGKEYMNDEMFNTKSPLNRDDCFMMWIGMKGYLEKKGWEVHTVDVYSDLFDIDVFVFFTFAHEWYYKIRKNNLEDKTVYVAFEPSVVDINHSPEGINRLLHYFKYILTWNDDLIDNKRIFKFMYPYYFKFEKSAIPFKQKKLLVNISGNKSSNQDFELYSERKKVIEYFDEYDGFELYGTGWDKNGYKSYKGLAKRKSEVYSKFKFALCLENMMNVKGYITEKILDCFCSGVVPIYAGASNILEYIPSDSFVHYDEFKDIEEMKIFLESINEEEYENYLKTAQEYLSSRSKDVFLPDSFGEIINSVAEKMNDYSFQADGSLFSERIKILKIKIINKIKKLDL